MSNTVILDKLTLFFHTFALIYKQQTPEKTAFPSLIACVQGRFGAHPHNETQADFVFFLTLSDESFFVSESVLFNVSVPEVCVNLFPVLTLP